MMKFNYPKEHQCNVLLVPFPYAFNISWNQALDDVKSRMRKLESLSFVKKDTWKVNVPLISRETGMRKNYCEIIISDDIEKIVKCKLLLDEGYWVNPVKNDQMDSFNCLWKRKGSSDKNKSSKMTNKDNMTKDSSHTKNSQSEFQNTDKVCVIKDFPSKENL